MKRILIYILVAVWMFSCVKDAEHRLTEDFYDIMLLASNVYSDDSGITFQGILKKQNKEEVIDCGFIWGTRSTSWNFTENDLEKWINESSDKTLRDFLLGSGTRISLGKLEDIQKFRYEQYTDIPPGKKYLVVAYLTTKDYTICSEVNVLLTIGSATPVIERIQPDIITCYESITIYGKNFCSNISDANITLNNGNWAYIQSISTDKIVCRIFGKTGPNNLRLSIYNKHVSFPIEIKGVEPETIEPSIAKVGYILRVKGKMMDKISQLFIGEEIAKIVAASYDEIQVEVPLLDKEYINRIKIIDQAGEVHFLDVDFQIITPRVRKELPNYPTDGNLFFSIGSKAYIQGNGFWELDLFSGNLTPKTVCPENVSYNFGFCFAIGDKAYIHGVERLWIYDTTTDTWSSGARYPARLLSPEDRISFSIGKKGYVLFPQDIMDCYFYEYDPNQDSWTQKGYLKYSFSKYYASTLQNKAYLYNGAGSLWVFDDELGTIIFKSSMDEIRQLGNIGGSFQSFLAGDQYLYIVLYGSVYDLYMPGYKIFKHDPNNDTTTLLFQTPFHFYSGRTCIWDNGKIYVLPSWNNFMYVLDTSKL